MTQPSVILHFLERKAIRFTGQSIGVESDPGWLETNREGKEYVKKLEIKRPLEVKVDLKSWADTDLDRTMKTLQLELKNVDKEKRLLVTSMK